MLKADKMITQAAFNAARACGYVGDESTMMWQVVRALIEYSKDREDIDFREIFDDASEDVHTTIWCNSNAPKGAAS